jgi:hypothetical protein
MSTPTGTAAPDSVAAGRPEPAAGLRPGQDGALPPAAPLALPASPDTPRQADARHGRGMPPAVNEPAGKELLAMPGSDATARAPSALRDTPAGQRAGGDGAPTTAALPPAWALAAARGADPAATLQAELRPPVGSQEFAPALGSQLSVMVRNGVEHAQLRLNPAEMGPIEVRIVLDGTQAQIDFSAAHALTRQALQEAVPALASALRESGLTLSGGGVFEQAREQRGDPRDDGPRQGGRTYGGGGELPAPAVPAPRSARTRGVVDLYA